MKRPVVGAYAVLRLDPADRPRILQHLLELAESDRRLRFGASMDDLAIARYVERIDFDSAAVLGAMAADGSLAGVAHVALTGSAAELGISVSDRQRQRGVGAALGTAALRAARELGARELRLHSAATNVPMRRLAERLGMDVCMDGSEMLARRALEVAPTAERALAESAAQ